MSANFLTTIQINPLDNVAVALRPLRAGDDTGLSAPLLEDIPQGHKVALRDIAAGEKIIKYGHPIGHAKQDIRAGRWVHVHNLATDLSEGAEYRYDPQLPPVQRAEPETFQGYRRQDGGVGIRNEIWIIPTVGCVNDIAERLAREGERLAQGSGVGGIHAFPHPYGCSQMSEDHETTCQLLANLARHPNAGGVLVLGLGCENNTMDSFRRRIGAYPPGRIQFLVCQEEADEIQAGMAMLEKLVRYAGAFRRAPVPVSQLVVGMKCGGSDGLSGITANPTVGAFSDMLIARGGSTILTEVPEMFGAESLLMNRAASREVFDRAAAMINDFKRYFTEHGQVVYENPSPGNKQGGISTLEDKSLGCVQKGGTAIVSDVIGYTGRVKTPGFTLMSGPGNDLVSATAMTAAGAHLILFTTGRGTPFGAPAPTVKISSNSDLFRRKTGWIDFDAGVVAAGTPIQEAAAGLLQKVIRLASGIDRTRSEEMDYRGIAIFKNGVTL